MGRLFRGEDEVGLVLVQVEPFAEVVGVAPTDAAQAELHDYDDKRFAHYGETLRVSWTDEEESRRLKASEFGT